MFEILKKKKKKKGGEKEGEEPAILSVPTKMSLAR